MMTPTDSPAAFQAFAAARGIALPASTPADGLRLMLAFYESVGAPGCDGPDGDMLLFQWGTYDWGDGRHFELNLTRQFIEQGEDPEDADDDAMSQLGLTYRFEATPERDALGQGDRWCPGRDELSAFRAFVVSSSPWAACANARAVTVVLDHSFV